MRIKFILDIPERYIFANESFKMIISKFFVRQMKLSLCLYAFKVKKCKKGQNMAN